MKKFAKMSLVAALAVAGTAASAQPLAEAIKNVDVSGTVVYRYNDVNVKNDESKTDNNYKIGLTAKSKVNDDVTAVTRFLVANPDGGFAGALDTQAAGDTNVDVSLSNVYFSYTGIANTTVNVGKQGLTTPWTVAIDADGNEQTGTGILALTNVGPVTLAAAYFNQTNLGESGVLNNPYKTDADAIGDGYADKEEGNAAYGNTVGAVNIATIGAMANVGPVALDAWYLDANDFFDSYTLGANAKFDLDGLQLGADLRFTSLDLDAANTPAHDLTKLTLTAKMGIFDAKYAYAQTDKDGGLVALDTDAKTTLQGWSVNPTNKADADYHQFVVGVQALPSLHISANYVNVEFDNQNGTTLTKDTEQEEIYTQLSYKMSKNFGGYIRFGQQENKNVEANGDKEETDYKGRLQVQYSF